MNTLSAEIIQNIFSFLPKSSIAQPKISLFPCLFVNKLWHDCSQVLIYEDLILLWPDQISTLVTTLTNTHPVNGGPGKYVKSLSIMLDEDGFRLSPLSKLVPLCLNLERLWLDLPQVYAAYAQQVTPDYAALLGSLSKLRILHGVNEAAEILVKCGARQITTLKLDETVPFTAVDGLGGNFPNLVDLSISLDIIYVSFLEDLAINCPNLDSLNLHALDQEQITNSHSRKITTSSLSTLSFNINKVDRSWIAHLAQRYPKLKRIMTSSLNNHERIDFCEIAQSCSSLNEFTCLDHGEGYAPTANFFKILSRTAAGNKGLRRLSLNRTMSFVDQDLNRAAICFGGSLCHLTLSCCDRITSDGLAAALNACHNLKKLSLSTKTGMKLQLRQLMSQCPRLESLKLDNIEVACAPSSQPINVQSHLKNVQLIEMKTWPVVLQHISDYCPNVNQILLRQLYLPDQRETCIDLPNHHIRLLVVCPFRVGLSRKESEYLVELTYRFQSYMTPKTCRFLCCPRCKDERHGIYCDCQWSQKSIEDKDIVSKSTTLKISIGQLDRHLTGIRYIYDDRMVW